MRYRRNVDENLYIAEKKLLVDPTNENYSNYLKECKLRGVEPKICKCGSIIIAKCNECGSTFCNKCIIQCPGKIEIEQEGEILQKECKELLCCQPQCKNCEFIKCSNKACSRFIEMEECKCGDISCKSDLCSNSCNECSNVVCFDCTYECGDCNNKYCSECISECSCNEEACPNEECLCCQGCGICKKCGGECKSCEHKTCSEHKRTCKTCKGSICECCAIICENCEFSYCDEESNDIGECPNCSNITCINCGLVLCVGCEEKYCEKCEEQVMRVCQSCSTDLCNDCLIACDACKKSFCQDCQVGHPCVKTTLYGINIRSRVYRPMDKVLGTVLKISERPGGKIKVIVEWDDDTAGMYHIDELILVQNNPWFY